MQRVYSLKTGGGIPLPIAGDVQSEQFVFYKNGTWMSAAVYPTGPRQQSGTYTYDETTGALWMTKDSDGKTFLTGYADEHVLVASHDGTLALQAVAIAITNWTPVVAGGLGLAAFALTLSSSDGNG